MTQLRALKYERIFIPFLLVLFTLIITLNTETVISYTLRGIRIALTNVIPIIFPYLIISDFFTSVMSYNLGRINKLFSKSVGLSPIAFNAFFCNLFCGFPQGIKVSTALYNNRSITKDEYEVICATANTPSFGFVVSAVGLTMRRNLQEGLLLYLIITLSSLLTAKIFSRKYILNQTNPSFISRQSFDIVASIKNAGTMSVSISSYIIFFSIITGLLSSFITSDYILSIISGLVEMTTGIVMINGSNLISHEASFVITSFMLGFSGLCVHFQAFGIMNSDASRKRYLLIKFIFALICLTISIVFVTVT